MAQLADLIKAVPLASASEIDIDLTLTIGGIVVPLKGTVRLK